MRATSIAKDPSEIDQVAMNLAADLLNPHTTIVSKEIHDETYKKMSGAGGAGGNKPVDVGAHELAFNLRYNNQPIEVQGPAGSRIQTMASMLPASATIGSDGKPTSLQDANNLRKVADVTQAFTVNGDPVNSRNAMITGNAYVQWFPVTTSSKGGMEIDQEGAAKWAQIQKQHPNVDSETLAKTYGASLNLRKLVVAEGVSFSDSRIGWWDGRDSNYYKPIDGDTERYVRDIVDPKGDRLKHLIGGDNTAHKHLIFMPALSEAAWREADNNHATAPASAFSLSPYIADGTVNPSPYNTGANGANIAQGMQYQAPTPVPANLGTDFFK